MSSAESQFLTSLDRDKYRGKWIAILDSKVIAEGTDLTEVYNRAMKEAKGRTPLFEQIPLTEEEQTLIL
jgi:Family of unknown function (DUF5678)